MTHGQAVSTHATERYLMDEMSEIERHQFEEHFFDCLDCAADVRAAAKLREGVKAGFAGTGRPEDTKSVPGLQTAAVIPIASHRKWKPAAVLPWAAAAVLAVSMGYQTLVTVPELRSQAIGTTAVEPVTLRAAARGAEPAVVRPAAGPVAFALEVNGVAAGTPLTYDVRSDGGPVVASGAATAPSPGSPLLILVPGRAFPSPGRYALSIRAAAANEPPADYRFSITNQ